MTWGGKSLRSRPEEFVNLQGFLVQSSKSFGFSLVQFSSLVTSLESSFSSVRGTLAKCLRSVRSVQFIQSRSRAPPARLRLTWPGWLGSAQARFGPSSLQLLARNRGAVLGSLQRKSQPAGPGFVALVEGWWALLAVPACPGCDIEVTYNQFKIVQKGFINRTKVDTTWRWVRVPDRVGCQSFSSGHGGLVPSLSSFSSVHSVKFTNSSGPA